MHLVEDFAEIPKIIFFLAQEPGQQEVGEFDRALLSIGDDEDDIDLREQPAERLHLPKLFLVGSREDGDRIRFYGRPESLPEVVQALEEFYSTFRDHPMNGGLESFVIFAFPTRIKKKLHSCFSLYP
jgi:hypothetical protein